MIKPYYDEGGITIYNSDCREILPELKDKSIDLKYIQKKVDDTVFRIKLRLDADNFAEFLPKFRNIWQKRLKNKINPTNIPSNAKWEDITIKFVDGHNVDIKCKDKTNRSDYKEMGFEDSKSRKPNKQWEFLKQLAENQGELAWEKSPPSKTSGMRKIRQDFGYDYDEDAPTASKNKGFSIIKAPDKAKKTKQLLAKTLKTYFRINEDPFFPYKKVKAYKIKIKLIA